MSCWVAICSGISSVSAQAVATLDGCTPVAGLSFICGVDRPEDLAHIPGTRWLIASGFVDGAGLKLIDTETKSMRFWHTIDGRQPGQNLQANSACQTLPDEKVFNAHGLSLRAQGDGRYKLYVVNHGGRESIELFTVETQGAEPVLKWTGCVLMPPGLAANSVAAYSDGTILATVLVHPGYAYADYLNGKNTGGVYEWKPGTPAFRLLRGTELPGNNGLEISRDEKEFYVVSFGRHSVLIYARTDTAKPLREAIAPGFMPDNIHWDGDRLIAAGMMLDEPACGGTRKIIDGKADTILCHRGYIAAELNPASMVFSILSYSEPNRFFNNVSSAVIVGNTLWLGSYLADRIAYRQLSLGTPSSR